MIGSRTGLFLVGSLLAAAAALSGCGESFVASSGGGGAGGDGGGGSQESRGERFAGAVCGQIFECCKPADLVELFSPIGSNDTSVSDYAGCRIYYRTSWESIFGPIVERSVKAGRMEFDEAAFDACLKAFADQPCADYLTTSPVCGDMFIPKVPAGGACSTELECTTGACQIPLGYEEGKCVEKKALAQAGEGCLSTNDCDEALHCDLGKCTAVKGDGQACSSDDQCQSRQCVGEHSGGGKCGKICEGGGPGPGAVDAALEAFGGPLVRAECARVWECCTPEESADLIFPGIDTEQECLAFTGVFTSLGLVAAHNSAVEGKVAVDGEELQKCLAEYKAGSCAELAKTLKFECPNGIQGLLNEGASCASDLECKTGYCNQASGGQGMCAALPGKEEACSTKCVEGTYCDASKCAEQKPLGSECTSDAQCAEGRCFAPQNAAQACTLICDGK